MAYTVTGGTEGVDWTQTRIDKVTTLSFLSTGITYTLNTTVNLTNVDYLVVGGGGGAINYYGGGGGGGLVEYGTLSLSKSNNYTIIVGAGGAPAPSSEGQLTIANNGSASTFYNIIANGGFGGVASSGASGGTITNEAAPAGENGNGGSSSGGYSGADGTNGGGGGAGAVGPSAGTGTGGNGGNGSDGSFGSYGAGGGGNGGEGSNFGSGGNGGNGGAGTLSTINNMYYGGGGGGGGALGSNGGIGGSGGNGGGGSGGNGSGGDGSDGSVGVSGTDNTGGGAGGSGIGGTGALGGGSGIVILSFTDPSTGDPDRELVFKGLTVGADIGSTDVTVTGYQTVQSSSESVAGDFMMGGISGTSLTAKLATAGTFFGTNISSTTYKSNNTFTLDFDGFGTISGQANTRYISKSVLGKKIYKLHAGNYKFDIVGTTGPTFSGMTGIVAFDVNLDGETIVSVYRNVTYSASASGVARGIAADGTPVVATGTGTATSTYSYSHARSLAQGQANQAARVAYNIIVSAKGFT